MINRNLAGRLVCFLALFICDPSFSFGDSLRGIQHGQLVPRYQLRNAKGGTIRYPKGKVVVMIYFSAEQKSSELAAVDANDIVANLRDEPLSLFFVTADVVHKSYFKKFWDTMGIDAPLAFDTGRKLYAKLGLIVFPTTIVINKEGRLAHVITTRSPTYRHVLDSYTRHALGLINNKELQERLTINADSSSTSISKASRHRATARLLLEKHLLSDAEKELKVAVKLAPKNAQIRMDLAELYLTRNEILECSKIVDALLKENPQHRRAKLLKGILLYKNDKLNEAEKVLKEALVLNPNPSRTHYYLALIYEKKGKKDQALKHYRSAIKKLLDL